MRNVALVTGASSGIGMELSRIHASKGGDLVIVARRRERLEELKSELEGKFGVSVFAMDMDLSEPGAAVELHRAVTDLGIEVEYLINNAGFGDHGFFVESDPERNRSMILLDVLTLTELTRFFLPAMIERKNGKILNVASMAGFIPGPLQAVYYATKAYVLSFSEALANEVRGTGVTVTALCPGATETEFAKSAGAEESLAFRTMTVSARGVARYGYEAMMRGKTVAVPGMPNKFLAHVLLRVMPRRVVTWISRRTMEKQ